MTFTFESTGLDQSDVAVLESSTTTNEHADAAEAALSIYDGTEGVDGQDPQEAAGDDKQDSNPTGNDGEVLADSENQVECLAAAPLPAAVHSPEVPATTKEKEKAAATRLAKRAEQLHQVQRKEGEVAAASVRWARLQAQTKRAKKHFDLAVEELSDLQDELGGDWADEEADDEPVDNTEIDRVDDGPISQVDQPQVLTVSPLPANALIAWRDVPTTEINLTGIRGLGEKKLEELIATCPTIGALEDMRASFGGLRNLKGIGEKTSDEIENRIIDWLSKNRDAAVLGGGEASSSTTITAIDSPPSITFNDSGNDVTASPVDLSDL